MNANHVACCTAARALPWWAPERDLQSASGFEYVLGKCRWCAKPWMHVFCGASGVEGYEPVTGDDVAAIRAIHDAKDLKDFMRRWGDRNP